MDVNNKKIKARRNVIAKAVKQSLKDFHAGKTPPMTAEAIINRLNQLQ
jgi:hypothetical protein